jgi:transposase
VNDAANLPNDIESMRALLIDAIRQRDEWKLRHDEKELDRLRLEMKWLQMLKRYYGRKADDLSKPEDLAQLLLDFANQLGALPVPEAEDAQGIADDARPADLRQVDPKTVRKIKRGRRNLAEFDHLPVTRKTHDLTAQQKKCACCGETRVQIGSESSWQLEYIPGHFERIEHVRFKYACRTCEQNAENPQIELADKPSAPIDKGLPGPGLLSFVVTSKFADYLPLYRLEDVFSRSGFEISRATMSVWCRDVATLVRPLYDLMVKRVLSSRLICTDDTTMPMLSPGSGKTRTARMWVYVGDGSNPYDVFHFTQSRSRDGPMKFLEAFKGTLLADGYGGYDGVVVGNDLTRAGCWAHARRKFVDAEKAHPQIAKDAVDLIGKLYDVERRAKEMNDEDRLTLRQAESRPILDLLHQRLSVWKLQLLPKHPMSDAIGYTLRQWKELNVFVTDGPNNGAVPIDNNISEREMKRIVLNRKNSLFVGNERGGETAAILASLTSTCRRHEIDPQQYLTQLMTNLPGTPISQLDKWLPDQWKAANPDQMPNGKV